MKTLNQTPNHPGDEELAAFALGGELPNAETIAEHVAHCVRCETLVARSRPGNHYRRSSPEALCQLNIRTGAAEYSAAYRGGFFNGCSVSLGGVTERGWPLPPGCMLVVPKPGDAVKWWDAPGINPTGVTTLEVEVAGDAVRTFAADGTQLLDAYIGDLPVGRIGLRAAAGASLEILKLEVKPLPPRPAAAPAPLVFGDRAPPLPARNRFYLNEFNKDNPAFETQRHGEKNGHYVIAGEKSNNTGWNITRIRNRDDFAIEAVARVRGAPRGCWGLNLSNWDGKKTTYGIYARISADGKAAILPGWFATPKQTGLPLIAPVQVPAILKGERYNRMLLVCRGDALWMYVNGTLVSGKLKRPPDLVEPVIQFTSEDAPSAELDRLAIYSPTVGESAFAPPFNGQNPDGRAVWKGRNNHWQLFGAIGPFDAERPRFARSGD